MEEENSNIVSNILFNNVRSKNILKIIFEYMERNKFLNLIRYNKILQKRLNITLEDYKNQSCIEIEIFPEEDKYGDFINFYFPENYYHIYFNNNEKEEYRNYTTKEDKFTKIKIIIDFEVESLYGLFKQCECIKKINFINFNRSNKYELYV